MSTAPTTLRELAKQRQTTEHQIQERVRELRAQGVSWTTIGVELGVSKQAARQRYGPATEPARHA